jgi:hypothetical protein
MELKQEFCIICAWRAFCQKKFNRMGLCLHCPDFVRDIALKDEEKQTKTSKKT